MTNDEHEADNVKRMGDVLGRFMHRLEAEYFWQLCNWHEYRSLYGTDEQRVALLNKAAAPIFSRLQGIIWESVLLGIARLTDPRKDVITFNRLPSLLKTTNPINPEHLTKISKLKLFISRVNDKSTFATDWRNNYIAHRNSARVLEGGPPLLEASRQHIEDAHHAMGELLNEVQLAFGGCPTMWNHKSERGFAESLLFVLSDGIRARERARQRFRNGTDTQQDRADRRASLWTPDESLDKLN